MELRKTFIINFLPKTENSSSLKCGLLANKEVMTTHQYVVMMILIIILQPASVDLQNGPKPCLSMTLFTLKCQHMMHTKAKCLIQNDNIFLVFSCEDVTCLESRALKHLAAVSWDLISLALQDKTTPCVPRMFTGAPLTSLWPPAPQSHCSWPGARCHMCHPPAASVWCSGSSSTESSASPSPSSLDSPTQSNTRSS